MVSSDERKVQFWVWNQFATSSGESTLIREAAARIPKARIIGILIFINLDLII